MVTHEKYNIVLITLDGLRPDMLTPFLNDLTEKGLFFPTAITAAPYTVASLHSVFSALLPREHGLNGYYKLLSYREGICKTLTEYLQEEGYYCFADVLNTKVIPSIGFDKISETKESGKEITTKHLGHLSKLSELSKSGKPFFFYTQYAHIHNKLVEDVGKKIDDFDKDFFSSPETQSKRYQEYVLETENYVRAILEQLSRLSLLSSTLLIFHSDHGASLGEKEGEKMYGSYLFDYTLKSFLLVMGPQVSQQTIQTPVSQIDIMPTILDYLNISCSKDYHPLRGRSLLRFQEGKNEFEEGITFSETGGLGGPWPSPEQHNQFCVRSEKNKVIYNLAEKRYSCYNLTEDPAEENELLIDNNDSHIVFLQKLLQKTYPEILDATLGSPTAAEDSDLIDDF